MNTGLYVPQIVDIRLVRDEMGRWFVTCDALDTSEGPMPIEYVGEELEYLHQLIIDAEDVMAEDVDA